MAGFSKLRVRLAAGVALATLFASGSIAAPAVAPAPGSKPAPASPSRIDQLEDEVKALSQEVQDLKRSGSSQYVDVQKQRAADVKVSVANGRPTFTSADGNFSASLRGIVQFDAGYYAQDAGALATSTDLSSGTNFRRARIGIDGKAFGDWEYSFLYDFGGSGVEGTSISAAYLQYNGFAPVSIRVGAFPPYASLEDSAGAADTEFLERASVTEISRGLTGGDGRSAVAVFANGDRYLASLAYTGGKAGTAASFDEQQALLGRFAVLLASSPTLKFVVGVNGSYIFDPADSAAGSGSPSTGVTYQNAPELRVDATNLVTTGNIDAENARHYGADAGVTWGSFYAEGGYTRFDAERRASTLPDPHFDGFYGQVSWLLTGESRRYDVKTASFRSPVVAQPFSSHGGGWGAWELAARYSTVDLNFRKGAPGSATPAGGIRGGEQKIWTAGLNWYPNSVVRVLLDYQWVDIDRLNGAGAQVGQNIDQVSARVQFAF